MSAEAFFRLVAAGLCHQLPQRSLAPGGFLLPFCARCTGVYLGFLVSIVFLWALNRQARLGRIQVFTGLFGLIVFASDMLVAMLKKSFLPNPPRLVVGALGGYFLATAVVFLATRLWPSERSAPTPAWEKKAGLVPILALALALAMLTLPLRCVGFLVALASLSGLLLLATSLNGLGLAAVLPSLKGTKKGWLVLLALMLSLGELFLLGTLARG